MRPKRALSMIVALSLLVLASCGATATDQWFEARSDLTMAEKTVGIAHDAGWIDDETLVDVVDPAVQSGRRYLAQAFELLPEGGEAFDHLMLLLDAVLAELSKRAAPPPPTPG